MHSTCLLYLQETHCVFLLEMPTVCLQETSVGYLSSTEMRGQQGNASFNNDSLILSMRCRNM